MSKVLNLTPVELDIEPLSKETASQLHNEIMNAAEGLRNLLWEMYSRKGWEALGFGSWHQYLEALGEAVDYTHQTLRKITDTAALEYDAELPIGTFREGAVRPIRDILSDGKGFTSKHRVKAIDLAVELAGEREKVTGVHARRAAMEIAVMYSGNQRMRERLEDAQITAESAYEIVALIPGDEPELYLLLSEMSDPELAETVITLSQQSPQVWKDMLSEVIATGWFPTYDGQVPLSKAKKEDLLDYLNAPDKQRRYEKAVTADQLRRELCVAARDYALMYWDVDNPPNEADLEEARNLWSALLKAGYIK